MQDQLSNTFAALADPTRRAILARLTLQMWATPAIPRLAPKTGTRTWGTEQGSLKR